MDPFYKDVNDQYLDVLVCITHCLALSDKLKLPPLRSHGGSSLCAVAPPHPCSQLLTNTSFQVSSTVYQPWEEVYAADDSGNSSFVSTDAQGNQYLTSACDGWGGSCVRWLDAAHICEWVGAGMSLAPAHTKIECAFPFLILPASAKISSWECGPDYVWMGGSGKFAFRTLFPARFKTAAPLLNRHSPPKSWPNSN